jgi:hypothetical protein
VRFASQWKFLLELLLIWKPSYLSTAKARLILLLLLEMGALLLLTQCWHISVVKLWLSVPRLSTLTKIKLTNLWKI